MTSSLHFSVLIDLDPYQSGKARSVFTRDMNVRNRTCSFRDKCMVRSTSANVCSLKGEIAAADLRSNNSPSHPMAIQQEVNVVPVDPQKPHPWQECDPWKVRT